MENSLQVIHHHGATLASLIDYAEKRSDPYFCSESVYFDVKVSPFHTVRGRAFVFVFLAEGKIIMESYRDFLGYLVRLIRGVSPSLAISGAVTAFIQ